MERSSGRQNDAAYKWFPYAQRCIWLMGRVLYAISFFPKMAHLNCCLFHKAAEMNLTVFQLTKGRRHCIPNKSLVRNGLCVRHLKSATRDISHQQETSADRYHPMSEPWTPGYATAIRSVSQQRALSPTLLLAPHSGF